MQVETFGDGDEPAPAVTAIQIGKLSPEEGAFHVAVDKGAVAFADGINRYRQAMAFSRTSSWGLTPAALRRG
jgi:hypothetical protein